MDPNNVPQQAFAPLTPEKKRRNLAMFVLLVLFVVVVFGVTIVKIKAGLA